MTWWQSILLKLGLAAGDVLKEKFGKPSDTPKKPLKPT
jgi:hypothetical protein